MKKLKRMIAGLLVVPFVALAAAAPAMAAGLNDGMNAARTSDMAQTSDPDSVVTSVVNIILWVVGVLAVVMIVFAGIKYITSNGDSGKVQSAKNTIVYSVVGLIVAIFAWAIVNFVVEQVN